METQNVSAEATVSPSDTAPHDTRQSSITSETSHEANAAGSTSTNTIDGTVSDATASDPAIATATEPKPTYVKLAMRNMVRKRGTSLLHFALTAIGLLAVLVGLAYITR